MKPSEDADKDKEPDFDWSECAYKGLRGPGAAGSATRMSQSPFRGKRARLGGCTFVRLLHVSHYGCWIVRGPLAPAEL